MTTSTRHPGTSRPPRTPSLRGWAALAVVALVAAACAPDRPEGAERAGGTVRLGPVDSVAALSTYGSCEALLERLVAWAAPHVGPWGWEGPWGGDVAFAGGARLAIPEAAADAAADTSAPASGGDGAFSVTNVQEAGVDEPDIVKTDGRRVVYLRGDTLVVATVADDGAPRLAGTLRLVDPPQPSPGDPERFAEPAWPVSMFLSGDTVVVFTQGWEAVGDPEGPPSVPGGVDLEASEPAASRLRPSGGPVTGVVFVDIADPSTPRVRGTETWEGSLVTARLIGTTVRVVLSTWRDPVAAWAYPDGGRDEQAAARINADLLARTTIDDWLPARIGPDGRTRAVDCDRVHVPGVFAGPASTTVVSLDVDGTVGRAVTVMAGGTDVYASATGLYVAVQPWVAATDGTGDPYVTGIHRFDLADPTIARWSASGVVPGHLIGQFAMSEHDGHLRVATTVGSPFGVPVPLPAVDDMIVEPEPGPGSAVPAPDQVPERRPTSESMVTVLRLGDGELTQVGQVRGLGPDEQIFAVRFVGPVAFVVTFRQVDPLYVVDLSDPAAPRVTGELKITGFSRYLHPVDDGLLIGVGQEATPTGRTVGLAVATFDVSDPASPALVDRLVVPGGTSEVEWDHKAFLWWAPERLAVVPYEAWDETQGPDVGALAVTVGTDGTLGERARIHHPPVAPPGDSGGDAVEADPPEGGPADPGATPGVAPDGPDPVTDTAGGPEPVVIEDRFEAAFRPAVRRAVVIGPVLWTFSDAGIGTSPLSDPGAVTFTPFG